MAPVVALLRKTYLRGRGPQRLRALISVTAGAQRNICYTQTWGFADNNASPNNGVDINAVLPDKMLNVVGNIVEPRMTALAGWTGWTHNLGLPFAIIDYSGLSISNLLSYKRLYVQVYGIAVGPIMGEASTDTTITAGSFVVELEYTSISGAEA